jgi:hypothetical protein
MFQLSLFTLDDFSMVYWLTTGPYCHVYDVFAWDGTYLGVAYDQRNVHDATS